MNRLDLPKGAVNSRSLNKPLRLRKPVDGLRACWPVIAFFAVLAFDFHGDVGEGGATQQYVVFLLALVMGVLGSQKLFRGNVWQWGLPSQVWLVVAVIGLAVVLQPLHRGALSDFMRLLVPYVLCLFGALLGVATARLSPLSQSHVLTGLLVVALVSGAWTFVYGFGIRGEDLFEGRFHLVAAITPHVFALAMLILAFPLPQRWLAGTIIPLALLLLVISITRAYLLVALGSLAFMSWVLVSRGLNARALRIGAIALGVLAATVVGTVTVLPEFTQRWTDRLFNEATEEGDQETAITREAEWVNQLDQMRLSKRNLLIGAGLGARYYWDERTLSQIGPRYKDMQEFREGVAEAGHSFWIYSAFSGGVLSGWMMPLVLLLTVYQGGYALVRLRIVRLQRVDDPRLLWDIALGTAYFAATLAVLVLSFSSNSMVDRMAAAFFGFVALSSREHLQMALQRAGLS